MYAVCFHELDLPLLSQVTSVEHKLTVIASGPLVNISSISACCLPLILKKSKQKIQRNVKKRLVLCYAIHAFKNVQFIIFNHLCLLRAECVCTMDKCL